MSSCTIHLIILLAKHSVELPIQPRTLNRLYKALVCSLQSSEKLGGVLLVVAVRRIAMEQTDTDEATGGQEFVRVSFEQESLKRGVDGGPVKVHSDCG
jgi:hypothetical protein